MYNTVSVKTCSFVEADCHRVFSSIFMFEKDWRAHVLERLTRRGRKILEFFGTFSHSAQWFLKSSQHGDNVKISVHLVPFFFLSFCNRWQSTSFFLFPPKLENAKFECTWGWFFFLQCALGLKAFQRVKIRRFLLIFFYIFEKHLVTIDIFIDCARPIECKLLKLTICCVRCLRCQKQFYSNCISRNIIVIFSHFQMPFVFFSSLFRTTIFNDRVILDIGCENRSLTWCEWRVSSIW